MYVDVMQDKIREFLFPSIPYCRSNSKMRTETRTFIRDTFAFLYFLLLSILIYCCLVYNIQLALVQFVIILYQIGILLIYLVFFPCVCAVTMTSGVIVFLFAKEMVEGVEKITGFSLLDISLVSIVVLAFVRICYGIILFTYVLLITLFVTHRVLRSVLFVSAITSLFLLLLLIVRTIIVVHFYPPKGEESTETKCL